MGAHFELYDSTIHDWIVFNELISIVTGDNNNYEKITEEEALRFIHRTPS